MVKIIRTVKKYTNLLAVNFGIIAFAVQGFTADFSLKGYATLDKGTTGGGGGTVTTVTSIAELDAFASACEKDDIKAPQILNIKGKISYTGSEGYVITIKRSANITIQGDASIGGELFNIGLNLVSDTNMIVQNLYIHEVFYASDALTIDRCKNIWVNRCEMHSKTGDGITVDTYDGLLDIKKGSINITISWCKLHDHMKCSLIGHTDKTGNGDENMNITYHHNWFYNTDGRNPSIRFGTVHMYNNIYESITDYGIAARDGAHAKVEYCIYKDVTLPMTTDKFTVEEYPDGYICESNNIFTGCGENSIGQAGCDYFTASTLPYSYTPDPVNSIDAIVKTNAGVPGRAVSANHSSGNKRPDIAGVKASLENNNITIVSKELIKSVMLADISGRVIHRQNVDSFTALIAMNSFSNKVYNIKVETVSGGSCYRIVR